MWELWVGDRAAHRVLPHQMPLRSVVVFPLWEEMEDVSVSTVPAA